MANEYRRALINASRVVSKTVALIFAAFSTVLRRNGGGIYYFTAPNSQSSTDAIQQDFKKTGEDLFRALNKYEERKHFKLSTKH